jgi:hypothetical protein
VHAAPIITALASLIAGCGARSSGDVLPDDTSAGETGSGEACGGVDWSGEPVALALPAGYPTGAFTTPEGTAPDCEARPYAPPTWWRADLTGDGLADLVVTRDCADVVVGDTIWQVYPAGADGFGQGVAWSLPNGFSAHAFATLEGGSPACEVGANVPAWHLDDMDGDGLVDLVSTQQCVDPTVGDTAWKVYPNTGSGFGDGEAFALPPGFSELAFVSPTAESRCETGANYPAWGIADLDADGRPDLVATATCVDLGVGSTHWSWWRNEGDAFASDPAVWDLPTGLYAPKLEDPSWACDYRDYQAAYFLADMDGDGALDMVSPFDCIDLAVGALYWNVYRSTGAGFEDIRVQWRLPDGYASGTFRYGELEAAACVDGSGYPAFELRDVDADARPDLIVTADCAGSTLGDTHWRVHQNEGDRFAAAPAEAPLPLGRSAYAFQPPARDEAACAGSGDRPAWTLWDTDADGRDDIVLTAACDDDTVGDARWLAHRGACRD